MRIIHTSDWHVGHSLYGFDRADEHSAAAAQLIKACEDYRPDALVIAGDIFDNDHPSAASQRLVAEILAELHRRIPEMAIIAIAGNHDSAARHESHAAIYEAIGARMIGRLMRDADISEYIVDIGSGVVAAIPFYISRGIEPGDITAEARRIAGDRPVVATGHAYVAGSDLTGHDEHLIGLQAAVATDFYGLTSDFDYLALGHIHRPQWVDAEHRARYSGSIIPVSFDENFNHSVSVVDIPSRGAAVEVKEIPITPHIEVVTIPRHGEMEFDEALEALRAFPDDRRAYVRLNVVADGPLHASAPDDARRAAEGKACRFCAINTSRRLTPDTVIKKGLTVDELKTLSPLEIARMYAEATGQDFDLELFGEILNNLDNSSDE